MWMKTSGAFVKRRLGPMQNANAGPGKVVKVADLDLGRRLGATPMKDSR